MPVLLYSPASTRTIIRYLVPTSTSPHAATVLYSTVRVRVLVAPALLGMVPPKGYLLPTIPTTYYLLPTTYYLLPTTYYLLPTTYYLLPTTYHLLPTTYYLLPATCYLLPTTYCTTVPTVLHSTTVVQYCTVQ